MNMKLWTALDWICRKSLERKLPFFPGKGDENMKKKKKKSRKMNPLRRYIQPLYNYQFSSKLDSSILVTALLSLATPTEDTNPLEFWLLHFLVSLHLSLSLSLSALQTMQISSAPVPHTLTYEAASCLPIYKGSTGVH